MFGRFTYGVTYNSEILPTYLSASVAAGAAQSSRASVAYTESGICSAGALASSVLLRLLFGLPEFLPCVALTTAVALRKAFFVGNTDLAALAEAEVFLFHWTHPAVMQYAWKNAFLSDTTWAHLAPAVGQWTNNISQPATNWFKASCQEATWR